MAQVARRAVAGLAVGVLLASTACSGGGDDAAQDDVITFWTPHNTPARTAIQKEIGKDFTKKTGIKVKVVGLAADDQNQSIASGAASGKLPDVVLHGVDQTVAWQAQGLLDEDAAQEVMEDLGEKTFNDQGLKFAKVDDGYVAVPSDSWGQMLYYRKDLFAKAGLEPPETLQDVVAAAEKLNKGSTAGIVMGTKEGDPFVTQTIEWIALANGCKLAKDNTNEPQLTSPNCVHALEMYQKLQKASVKGAQDVESTRAAYQAGRAAMISWSAHLLDEIAGLDQNFPPTCKQCKKEKDYIAKNTGVVTALGGPDVEEGTQYGLPFNLGIMKNTDTEGAKKFVEYMLSDGYAKALSTAAEGRFPMRNGTKDDPTKYLEAWKELKIGNVKAAEQRKLSDVYDQSVLDAIENGATHIDRWGFGHGYGPLAASMATENVLARNVGPLFGGKSPTVVAQTMQKSAETAAKDLE